jgi:DNA-binding Lrp family transcriptional regulator
MNKNNQLLTAEEANIVAELIKNPRISDNQIAKNTKIPVMSVNRKRKAMEEKGLINYYATIKKHQDGIGIFSVRQLYIIKLKAGITRQQYIEVIELDPSTKLFNCTFISSTFLGEKDGQLAIIIILDAVNDAKLMDEFNGKIITTLKRKFGNDAVQEITTAKINDTIRIHHNYLPKLNMEKGIIKGDWPRDQIFVDDETKITPQDAKMLKYDENMD